MTKKLRIDLEDVRNALRIGIRRAAFFMGLGLNAALDPNYVSYKLGSLPNELGHEWTIDFIGDLGNEHLAQGKEEFALWIITGGLRELVESFAIFLDRTHKACLICALHKRVDLGPRPHMLQRQFHKYGGIGEKLSCLEKRFSIRAWKTDALISIARTRNCLTHRGGVVHDIDAPNGGPFVITWWMWDPLVKTPDGNIARVFRGMHLPDGGDLMLRFDERRLEFPINSRIRLTPQQLLEICLFVDTCAAEIMKSVVQYFRSLGVDIPETPVPVAPSDYEGI